MHSQKLKIKKKFKGVIPAWLNSCLKAIYKISLSKADLTPPCTNVEGVICQTVGGLLSTEYL